MRWGFNCDQGCENKKVNKQLITRKKQCKQTIDFTKKNVNKPVHVEEGPDDDDDDDGGVDDDVDVDDS